MSALEASVRGHRGDTGVTQGIPGAHRGDKLGKGISACQTAGELEDIGACGGGIGRNLRDNEDSQMKVLKVS